MMSYWGVGDIVGHIVSFIVIVAIVMLIIRILFGRRRGMRGIHWGMHHQNALSILSERFAKGEISKEEFEEKKQVLMQ